MKKNNKTDKVGHIVIRNTKSKLREHLPAFEALLGGRNGQGASAYFTDTNVISSKQIVCFSVVEGEDTTAVLSLKQRMDIFKKHLPETPSNPKKITVPPEWATTSSNIFFITLPLDAAGQKNIAKMTYNAIIEQGAMCDTMYFLDQYAKANKGALTKRDMKGLYKAVSERINYELPVTHFAHEDQITERTDGLLSKIPNEKDRTKATRMIDINLALAVREVESHAKARGLRVPVPRYRALTP